MFGMKLCSNVPSHMTKMASRPIYGKKTSKISFFGTKILMTLKFGIQHRIFKYFLIYANDDPGLTLTISICFLLNASTWVKAYTAKKVKYFQACSNSAYPQRSCERYKTIGPLEPVSRSCL